LTSLNRSSGRSLGDTRGNAIFPYTYSTMLRSAGTNIKVQPELLRHAHIQTTMNIYTDGLGSEACRAQHGCGGVLSGMKNSAKTAGSHNEWELISTCHNCRKQHQVIEGKVLDVGCGGLQPVLRLAHT
jgi:hypothetical protein